MFLAFIYTNICTYIYGLWHLYIRIFVLTHKDFYTHTFVYLYLHIGTSALTYSYICTHTYGYFNLHYLLLFLLSFVPDFTVKDCYCYKSVCLLLKVGVVDFVTHCVGGCNSLCLFLRVSVLAVANRCGCCYKSLCYPQITQINTDWLFVLPSKILCVGCCKLVCSEL